MGGANDRDRLGGGLAVGVNQWRYDRQRTDNVAHRAATVSLPPAVATPLQPLQLTERTISLTSTTLQPPA
ncbi:MAG: hypothetical protein WBA99_06105, partial [Nodosilinea sp.]